LLLNTERNSNILDFGEYLDTFEAEIKKLEEQANGGDEEEEVSIGENDL